MKLGKIERITIVLTLLFFSFAAGYFIGRNAGTSRVTIDSGTEAVVYPSEDPLRLLPPALSETGEKININTADADELTKLPGIGEALAQRIIDYRTEHGAFASTAEITNVSGIGDTIYKNIQDSICVK